MKLWRNFPTAHRALVFILFVAALIFFVSPVFQNAGAGSEMRLSAVFATADVMPPRITGAESSNIGTSSAVILWETNEPADSLVEYGLSISFGFESAFYGGLTNSHAITITDLTPGTPYYYRVRSKDAAGNRAVSEEYRVRTLDRPADPNNSVLTIARVLPGQFDNTKYTVSISDSDGLGDIRVETAGGGIIRANNLRYGFYGGIRACPA